MRITNVEAIILRLPVRQAVADGTQDDLLIRIETDEGITGYGEVDTSPEVGKAVVNAEMSHGTCYGLREILVGQDPFDIEQIWESMYRTTLYYGRQGAFLHARSGVDMALWDILGKALGKPVHKLLGGSFCEDIRAGLRLLTTIGGVPGPASWPPPFHGLPPRAGRASYMPPPVSDELPRRQGAAQLQP